MSLKLGLTGSIGMGKSTTSGFFRELDVPVWDADKVVHEIYAPDGAAVAVMAEIAPAATRSGFVDRAILRNMIKEDRSLLAKIEMALKPILTQSRTDFLKTHQSAPLVLFDIPLLYETDAESWLDYVLVVTAPPEVQKQRVLEREGMDETMFETMLSRQMPDAEKRALADFVFDTSYGMEHTKMEVKNLIERLKKQNA